MAEPLKNQYGFEVAERLARSIAPHDPQFNSRAFLKTCRTGYEELELMPRGRHLAQALRKHLPEDYPQAIRIIRASLGKELAQTERNGMTPFFYLPHTIYVAEYGLEHRELSMQALYELTQRFTAEFSIRPFLEKYPEETLAQLHEWATDDNVHVRRLVSEGTRPRLPWASRLKRFQEDPTPGLELLERLKDDPELYVRRSVANHLNDIGKDHPHLLFQTTQRWMKKPTPERAWLVRHALRSSIKQGAPEAFAILGYAHAQTLEVLSASISPDSLSLGEAVTLTIELQNTSKKTESAIVDFRIHFVKANGQTRPKTFKLKAVQLSPGERLTLSKNITLKPMTTRTHFAGEHGVDLLINGQLTPVGTFVLHTS